MNLLRSIATRSSSRFAGPPRGAVGFAAVALLGVLWTSTGCPGPEYPKCERDDQCKKDKDGKAIDQFCLFGQCQECAKDAHCQAGYKCNRGRCDPSCTNDEQCAEGQICEGSACVAAECSEADPCGGGQECTKGRCITPATSAVAPPPAAPEEDCERKMRVPFDFNVHDLRPDARDTLDRLARCMQQNGDWRVVIEGHADERGTTDYNLQLGERRAASIRDYLVRLGVDKARFKTISFGEERPLNHASNEGAWAENRRGEIIVGN